mgnify:CR=1 FL=1
MTVRTDKRGFNTALETACNVPWAFVEKVLPHVDTMLHDHKLTIPERHKKWTGVSNRVIKDNLALLAPCLVLGFKEGRPV